MKSVLLVAAFLLLGSGMASAANIQYTVIFEADQISGVPNTGIPNPDQVFGSFKVNVDNTKNYSNETGGIDLINLNLAFDSQLAFDYNAASDRFTFGGLAHGAASLVSFPAENDFRLVIDHFSAGLLNSRLRQFSYAQTVLGNFLFQTNIDPGGDNFALVIAGPVVATTPIPAALPLLLTALGGLGFAGFRRKRAAALSAA